MSSIPEKTHKTREVFGISRDLPENYVTRQHVDGKFVDSLAREKHLIVHGGSKQGKTSLRKYNLKPEDYVAVSCQNKWTVADLHAAILKSAGYQVTQSNTKTSSGQNKITVKFDVRGKVPFIAETSGGGEFSRDASHEQSVETKPLDLDPADVNDIISALESIDFKKFIILEDFHYLPLETQRDFSFALKAFHEQSKLTFIIVGVWKEENRLTRFNGDLTNRVIPIDADTWDPTDLIEVINAGETLLNVQFDQGFKVELANGCFNSVYIVQEACYRVCEESEIFETAARHKQVRPTASAGSFIKKVVEEQSGRYRAFINAFAAGFSSTGLEMYKWIIFVVLKSKVVELESGLRLNRIVQTIKNNHPKGSELQTLRTPLAMSHRYNLRRRCDPSYWITMKTKGVWMWSTKVFLFGCPSQTSPRFCKSSTSL